MLMYSEKEGRAVALLSCEFDVLFGRCRCHVLAQDQDSSLDLSRIQKRFPCWYRLAQAKSGGLTWKRQWHRPRWQGSLFREIQTFVGLFTSTGRSGSAASDQMFPESGC